MEEEKTDKEEIVISEKNPFGLSKETLTLVGLVVSKYNTKFKEENLVPTLDLLIEELTKAL